MFCPVSVPGVGDLVLRRWLICVPVDEEATFLPCPRLVSRGRRSGPRRCESARAHTRVRAHAESSDERRRGRRRLTEALVAVVEEVAACTSLDAEDIARSGERRSTRRRPRAPLPLRLGARPRRRHSRRPWGRCTPGVSVQGQGTDGGCRACCWQSGEMTDRVPAPRPSPPCRRTQTVLRAHHRRPRRPRAAHRLGTAGAGRAPGGCGICWSTC